MLKVINIKSTNKVDMIDITSNIKNIIKENDIEKGLCTVYVPHTTAGITINECADPNVVRDITREVNKIVPFDDNYKHLEGNSAAHIKASFFGSSETIIIEDSKLLLGTWQGIYFCEFDGPRRRKVFIKMSRD